MTQQVGQSEKEYDSSAKGQNHHNQIRVCDGGFLSDEKTESCNWLLNKFVETIPRDVSNTISLIEILLRRKLQFYDDQIVSLQFFDCIYGLKFHIFHYFLNLNIRSRHY